MAVDLRQTHFRFGYDDGTESTHTWIANEDTNAAVFTGTKFLLRFTVQEAGGTASVDTDFQFQYNKNAAGWNDITTSSSVVKSVTPGAWANGANCTKRLSGTGTFETSAAGCTTDGSSGGASCDIAASGNTETECALQLISADIADGDTIQFRLTSPDYAITYTVTPSLTVEKTGISSSKSVVYGVLNAPLGISVSKGVVYAALIDIGLSINVSKAVVYSVLSESTAEPPYDDATSPGGMVFGGEVVEVVTNNLTDPEATGGIVFGSSGDISTPESNQVDGEASGGIVFGGGDSSERWVAEPNNLVAVKSGTYRISGVIYTLAVTMSYAGLGDIAALVNCSVAPTVAGTYRYDLLSVDSTGSITVTAGAEATVPVMPALPASSIKLDHVLRYYGQTSIVQSDIGKIWLAPALVTLTAVIADDELAWAELSTTITITCRDQYGQLFTGSKTVNAAFESGNGTVAPLLRSGGGSSFVFTYTRLGIDPGDISPMLTFSSTTGALCVAFIKLLDAGGGIMI